MAKPATKPKGESSPQPPGPGDNSVSPDKLKAFYRDMLLIRRFEERAGQLYGMGLIGGFCHLYIGQEAVVVGMQSTIVEKDAIITSYRDHGHMLAAAMDPKGVMAELTGRSTGYSKGKGGSMHMFSREKNFYGGHGIVGAQVPIGTGLAFAHKYNGHHNVSLTYFGDGSANQGQVYEAMNMAALWKLPAVYIIENNRYGMGPQRRRPLHPRDADLSLSRPFDERPREVPDQGRGRQVSQRTRSDRPCTQAVAGWKDDRRSGAEGRRCRDPQDRERRGGIRPA